MKIDSITCGTCGKCGGPVTIPNVWMGTQKPTPKCEKCEATVKENYGKVLPMK